MTIQLRPYQTEAIDAFMEQCAHHPTDKRGLVVLPTGTGKTVFGLALAKRIGGRTLWIAHRDELITQPIKALRSVWPEMKPGVVKADRNEWHRDFVFASVQTAWRQHRREKLTGFDLVVVDEAHHSPAKSHRLILESAGCFSPDGPPLLGLTATPERSDKTRLDDIFQKIVYQFQLRQAVESGYLVGVEMAQRPIKVDLDKVGMSGGDFKEGELDAALLEAGIVDDVVRAVYELAHNRKTIIFTISVRQAKQISDLLCTRGYRASWVAGKLDVGLRRQRLAQFAKGEITHMVNCMVLTEGFDDPTTDCILMARPTKSKPLYVQCVGRGLRIAPGKENCLIVDMVGLSSRHTLIQAPVIFGLEDSEDTPREPSDSDDDRPNTAHRQALLDSQLKGVASVARSQLKWVPVKDGVYALNCGEGGNVIMRQVSADGWMIEVVGRASSSERESLTMEPVELELAQGIAEDYVRRSSAVYLTEASARWRDAPATEKQKQALQKWRINVHPQLTKGEASDLMTKASASSWRNDPATPKQKAALHRLGETFDEQTITKGQAGRLLGKAARR